MSEPEVQIINLEVTVAETNVILRSLSKHPFEEVAALIAKIRGQGEAQVNAAAADAAPAPTPITKHKEEAA